MLNSVYVYQYCDTVPPTKPSPDIDRCSNNKMANSTIKNNKKQLMRSQSSSSSPKFNSSTAAKASIKAASQKRFIRGILLGFLVGIATSSMFSMVQESDSHLKHLDVLQDMAAGSMPFLHHSIQQQQQQSECNDTITTPITTITSQSSTQTVNIEPISNQPTVEDRQKGKDESSSTIQKLQPTETRTLQNQTKDNRHEGDDDDHLDGIPIANPNVKEFDPTQRVVIVTKIHGPENLNILEQMICLLTQAYNNRVQYDIIIFSSDPINSETHPQAITIQKVAEPAKLTFITDNPGLHTMVDSLSPERRQHLLQRCNVTETSELTWFTKCLEQAGKDTLKERIAYNWQAEFRSKHLWVHPSMMKYKYMLWFDVDAFCSKIWEQDPIAVMAKYNLALLFDHFPQGVPKGNAMVQRIYDTFGKVYCEFVMTNGTLVAKPGKCLGKQGRLRQVHGFFHITDLDFYRSPPVLKWHETLIGDSKFYRQFDDQIGVTVPAAVLASNRSWDMRYHGVKLDIIHNYYFDGLHSRQAGGFIKWWKTNGQTSFPTAYEKCTNINAAG